tara:strand:+ start:362 stop:616 length:255 start_codon:yes stop_codon:yes gene_type:complete
MAFKMKYKNLKEVVEQLDSAVVAHGKQAKTIKKHIDEMEKKSPLEKKVSWEWDGKTHYGDYIREDSEYVYARTVNGKIKKKPKK